MSTAVIAVLCTFVGTIIISTIGFLIRTQLNDITTTLGALETSVQSLSTDQKVVDVRLETMKTHENRLNTLSEVTAVLAKEIENINQWRRESALALREQRRANPS